MIALILRLLQIIIYVKEVFLQLTGSALDEDGSHHQLPYRDHFKANKFTLGAL